MVLPDGSAIDGQVFLKKRTPSTSSPSSSYTKLSYEWFILLQSARYHTLPVTGSRGVAWILRKGTVADPGLQEGIHDSSLFATNMVVQPMPGFGIDGFSGHTTYDGERAQVRLFHMQFTHTAVEVDCCRSTVEVGEFMLAYTGVDSKTVVAVPFAIRP